MNNYRSRINQFIDEYMIIIHRICISGRDFDKALEQSHAVTVFQLELEYSK